MDEIFNIFKKNTNLLIIPSSNLCIDETFYAARMKCQFIQFMKSKPARYGIKFWSLVDVNYNYLLDINIYLGKMVLMIKKKLSLE